MMETTKNCMVRVPDCMLDSSSLQRCGAQATLKSSCMWPSIVLIKNPPSKKFWLFLPHMIRESFQYHFVILLTYSYFWRLDMLVDHPSAIEEANQHHFAHWLLLGNLFHPGFATMEPHLWLMFHFRMVVMNLGFVNSDYMSEKVWNLWDVFRIICQLSTGWMAVLFNHHWHYVDVCIHHNSSQSLAYMLNLLLKV